MGQEQDCPEITPRKIKCIVWDLDNTLWDGILLENPDVRLKQDVVAVIKLLDQRGILHSIASRGDHALAMQRLEEFGLADYFLYPQVNWNSKADSIKAIADELNLDVNSFAFVDDQVFEREEVRHFLAGVLCVDAADAASLPDREEMKPLFQNEDSKLRRLIYRTEQRRQQEENSFHGSKEEFLSTLGMHFEIGRCRNCDLQRAEELTVRTHQMNATGYTYSYAELAAMMNSPSHLLLIAGLKDRLGSYGKIGLALVETTSTVWTLKLLLMSCRVVSRGVGTILLSCIMKEALRRGVRLQAEFRPNPRNRIMQITYGFAGFRQVEARNGTQILETNLENIQDYPGYVRVQADLDAGDHDTILRSGNPAPRKGSAASLAEATHGFRI